MRVILRWLLAALVLSPATAAVPSAQDGAPGGVAPLHRPLDDLLDLYVRDGLVYYAALGADRAKLDRYVAALGDGSTTSAYAGWTREEQMAFWLNAYNAIVLQTVVDRYPIRGRAPEYPPASVRQIPGAFERLTHRVAGRSVTLDAIEHDVLAGFRDPRLYLALGRGAVGSPRLRSEAFTSARLAMQLANVAAECPARRECVSVDATANRVVVTPVVGWHQAEFVTAYAGLDARFPERSPIERAVLAFVDPHLFTAERAFLANRQFTIAYGEIDWTLNDLTGR